MSAHDQIVSLMEDRSLDSPDVEPDRIERIEEIIKKDGWEPVRESLFRILKSAQFSKGWHDAMGVLWGAVLDKRSLDADATVALLHWCFERAPASLDENLVWSITSKLKAVGYLSDYEPLKDPGVLRELNRMKVE